MTKDTVQKKLAKNLRKYRAESGFSQEHLAHISGVSRSTVNALESGATVSPRMETIETLAEALGISAQRLLGLNGNGNHNGKKREELIEELHIAQRQIDNHEKRLQDVQDVINEIRGRGIQCTEEQLKKLGQLKRLEDIYGENILIHLIENKAIQGAIQGILTDVSLDVGQVIEADLEGPGE